MRLRSDKQAIECYQEACRGLRTLPQEFKPAVLPKPLLMLAQLYQRSKDPAYHQEIEKLLTEALDEARKKRDMPKQLATACLELGKYRMASNSSIAYVELFEEAIPLLEKHYGESHLMHLQGLALYDVTLRKLGRTSEADQVRKKLERHESLYASATRGTGSTIRQLLNGEITFWQISK